LGVAYHRRGLPSAVTTSAAIATAAVTATTAAAAWACSPLAGFINRQRAAAHFAAVEGGNGRLHSVFVFHFDETETA
jgi:hypothetical protein